MSACLSDEEVVAFAVGRMSGSRLPEVHAHLDQCETCQYLLNEAAHALATAATLPSEVEGDSGWNTTFRPGTLVGQRYLIRRFIVRGGMGEVYEAFDQELQGRVALKTVTSTACDNPRAVRLLKGEVLLARRVSHPHVCRIYDFGTHVIEQTGAQISFLTMEFVEGETLGQRVRLSGGLALADARRLGRQLLLGLSAAHDAGVLHRDFKSDNVMLRSDPDHEIWPLIMDFGLARALDQDSRQGSSSSNSLLGTLGYIAPEQLEGKPHSKASDVYAFGVVWFEMLTGELPFDSNSSPAATVLERLKRAAPPPSSKNPLVSRELDAVVLGCLQRSPKDRYRTVAEVLAALDALEALEARAPAKRRRSRLLATAMGIGFALSGLSAYSVFHLPSPKVAPATLVPTLSPAQIAEPQPPSGDLETSLAPPSVRPTKGDVPASSPTKLKPNARPTASKASAKNGAPAASSAPADSQPDKPQAPIWENPFPPAELTPPANAPHPT